MTNVNDADASAPLDQVASELPLADELLDPVSPPEAGSSAARAPATVTDYVSGKQVRATPEEVEAVQVFSRRLVEELGYPKAHIQTRPQYRVRSTPSGGGGKAKSYPIDIAVFSSSKKLESDAYIIVECKKKTRKDGEEQLRIYMSMAPSAQKTSPHG